MLCYSQYLNVKSLQLHWLLVWDRIQHNVCLLIYFVSVLLYYLLWKLCKKVQNTNMISTVTVTLNIPLYDMILQF